MDISGFQILFEIKTMIKGHNKLKNCIQKFFLMY